MTRALRVHYINVNNEQLQNLNFKLPDNVKTVEKIELIEITEVLEEKVVDEFK